MVAAGFVEEVRLLKARPNLGPEHASMRAVGYRQLWAHLAGDLGWDEARGKALAATRQLAKRQMTWLRSDTERETHPAFARSLERGLHARVEQQLGEWS
jgi:tRNA dimethylallyltransferase